MILNLWNDLLYQPLFNFLIWIYNTWTDGNLGWAVVVEGEIDAIAKRADMLVTLDENTWKGHSKLQLMIKDVKGSLEKEG